MPSRLQSTFRVAYCFIRQILLLLWEVPVVWFFMAKLKAGALPSGHAWITGDEPDGSGSVWRRNIVYRSPTRMPGASLETDEHIIEKTGLFLAKMVGRSIGEAEIPQGPRRRMPHAVNYIHGSVHYNGAFLVFDDFLDLSGHLADAGFRRDLIRFGREEKREVTLVFRQRVYDPLEYAYCIGCVRAHLPWFSNGNGPSRKPVLWGNTAPHPAINLINGAWMGDRYHLWRGDYPRLIRKPIEPGRYFQRPYLASKADYSLIEKLLAWYMFMDVRSRGFWGQLFFTNRRKIEPHRLEEYRKAGGYWNWYACYHVPFPLQLGMRKTPVKPVSTNPEQP